MFEHNLDQHPDIELVLIDNFESRKIHCHKNVLMKNSSYFKAMLNFGVEKDQTKITIKMDNSGIARKLIRSLHGVEKTPDDFIYDFLDEIRVDSRNKSLNKLLEIKCRSFFCLDSDVS